MPDPSLAAAYATLGLAPGASPEEVKRAWRKMARATHPDLHPDDPDAARRFKAAEAAHALLTDPARAAAAARGAPYPGGRGAWAGPDEDWMDACAWIAEAHLMFLRSDALPRYATRHAGGPSLASALAAAAERAGLVAGAPEVTPSRFGRAWTSHTWRRLELVVDDGRPMFGGPVGLLKRDGRVRIVLWPRVLWAEGVRDDDVLRTIVRRAVDLGVAAAAPVVLDVPPPYAGASPTPADDRRWWAQRLLWPTLWLVVAAFSLFLLAASWQAANAPPTLRY